VAGGRFDSVDEGGSVGVSDGSGVVEPGGSASLDEVPDGDSDGGSDGAVGGSVVASVDEWPDTDGDPPGARMPGGCGQIQWCSCTISLSLAEPSVAPTCTCFGLPHFSDLSDRTGHGSGSSSNTVVSVSPGSSGVVLVHLVPPLTAQVITWSE
jgi:hypothetical protein